MSFVTSPNGGGTIAEWTQQKEQSTFILQISSPFYSSQVVVPLERNDALLLYSRQFIIICKKHLLSYSFPSLERLTWRAAATFAPELIPPQIASSVANLFAIAIASFEWIL